CSSSRVESPSALDYHDVAPTTILYLLQEATKLSAPAQDPAERRVERGPSGQNPARPTTFSTEESCHRSILDAVHVSSPWEVMSLINLQCERLLHSDRRDDCRGDISGWGEDPGGSLSSSHNVAAPVALEGVNEKHSNGRDSVVNCILEKSRFPSNSESFDLNLSTCTETQSSHDSLPEEPVLLDLNNNLQASKVCENLKQAHPCRSADLQDPNIQGVAFRMSAEVDESRGQSRLLITPQYRLDACRRKPRRDSRSLLSSQRTSSSEEESDSPSLTSAFLTSPAGGDTRLWQVSAQLCLASSSGNKMCASCCTRKTPLWRDAEDGTPLCNACGIRYKKYRIRCLHCWHIPRKEGSSNSRCFKCGDTLHLTSQHKRL
uniref:GATA-type domain-containing protein n=1 Tax=Denticeps clupeoides TaxID=299321 RepID=A0AAY3ZUL8_9TELE